MHFFKKPPIQLILPFSIGVVILLISSPLWTRAQALNMTNNSFVLHTSQLNTSNSSTVRKNNGKNFTSSIILQSPSLYIKDGFAFKTSNQYFLMTIIGDAVNFEALNSGSPVYRTSQISISDGSAYGYSLIAQENHPLLNAVNGTLIPNTTCDNGVCSETTSDQWSNVLTYGFGYRCDNVIGSNCSVDFSNEDYYKDFANSPSYGLVASSFDTNQNHITQVTYKVNISPSQQQGIYKNDILYIGLPKF